MKHNKWTTVILTLMCLGLILPIHASATDKSINTTTQQKTILALVNGTPIYEWQLEPQVQAGIKKYKRFNKKQLPDNLKHSIQEKVLEKFIVAELISQASQQEKITDLDQKVKKEIKKRTAKNKDQTVNKEHIKHQIQIDEYLKKHNLINPQLSKKELREFYEKNKEGFASKQETAHVLHIVVKKNKNKVIEARKLILDGKPFSEVAKEISEDANAPQGGNLGFMEPKYMPEAFDKIAFSIPINTLSDIIKTEHGYHILKVLERKPKGTIPAFDDMKDFLSKGLSPQLKAEKVAAHVKKLKAQANIKVLLSPSTTETSTN